VGQEPAQEKASGEFGKNPSLAVARILLRLGKFPARLWQDST
jgi:hypothetical protein